ncbi:MAG: sigma-70 family RNA polymerase sigma factor, partial [Verrucomicrobiota bacterium]
MSVATGNGPSTSTSGGTAGFPATRWSLVRSTAGDDTVASDAMSELCRLYWYPLYVFARRQGLSPQDAEDATQGFLARVIEKGYLTRARSDRGTLRSFLLKGLKYFLANERKAARRLKRGGGSPGFSLDAGEGEIRFQRELAHDDSPDRLFDRKWATVVIERALSAVKEEYVRKNK